MLLNKRVTYYTWLIFSKLRNGMACKDLQRRRWLTLNTYLEVSDKNHKYLSQDTQRSRLNIEPSPFRINRHCSTNLLGYGRAIAHAVSCRLPTAAAGVWAQLRSGHVGFVVNKVALGHVFSEHFCFPCQFLFHRLLHIHHHLSSGAGTIGQLLAEVPSGLMSVPPHTKKLKKKTK
jgi:hypothetical protein